MDLRVRDSADGFHCGGQGVKNAMLEVRIGVSGDWRIQVMCVVRARMGLYGIYGTAEEAAREHYGRLYTAATEANGDLSCVSSKGNARPTLRPYSGPSHTYTNDHPQEYV